jgi:hypothetical protein
VRSFSVLWRAILVFAFLPVAVAHADDQTLKIFQPVRDGGLQFLVKVASSLDGSGQATTLTLIGSVSNVGDLPLTYNAAYQNLVDKRGRVFAPAISRMLAGSEISFVVKSLNPGIQIDHGLVFEIPEGTQVSDYSLVWRQSLSSAGATLKLTGQQM